MTSAALGTTPGFLAKFYLKALKKHLNAAAASATRPENASQNATLSPRFRCKGL